MARAIVGFCAGCAVTALIVWAFVLPRTRASYHAVGVNDGTVSAQWAIADEVSSSIGRDLVPGEKQDVLFVVKTRSVVIVERNRVKTLRVVE